MPVYNIVTVMYVQTRQTVSWALAIFLGSTIYLYSLNNMKFKVVKLQHTPTSTPTKTKFANFRRKETRNFLINTPGCYIPNYAKTFNYNRTVVDTSLKAVCGQRAIFIDSVGNNLIRFRINKNKLKLSNSKSNLVCCYKFATRSTVPGRENTKLGYSKCRQFKDGSKVTQLNEIVTVTCIEQRKIGKGKANRVKGRKVYEDAYIILKKIKEPELKLQTNDTSSRTPWNVLLIGLDTMSRTRLLDTMPLTANYLIKNKWLDYKGYHKVGHNTFPNVMSVMTGKKMSTIYSKCKPGFVKCTNYFIWSKYKDAGYKTAHGEDDVLLPDTFSKFNGFKEKPTDHFMRPFFFTGERRHRKIMCTHMKPSATHLLEYAHSFVNSYKNDSFFGMFWINSYTHNVEYNPSLLDDEIVGFFNKLNKTGAFKNTFVFFLSDHGTMLGNMRIPVESYYDERLPMFFAWTPHEFRRQYTDKYYNLHLNQDRLTSHYDFYLTLMEILKLSDNSSVVVEESEACPQCLSLFEKMSLNRTCADAGIGEDWCSCHNMTKINHNDKQVARSLQLTVAKIKNHLKTIKTINCMTCKPLNTPSILRSHVYHANNNTYHVIAFTLLPGPIRFETVVANYGQTSKVILLYTTSKYNTRGNCIINPNDRSYCVCATDTKCKYKAVAKRSKPKCNGKKCKKS